MVVGLLLGRGVPGLGDVLQAVQVDGISLPIAVGLLVMMYPVLAKVRYDRMGSVTGDRRLLVSPVYLGKLYLDWVLTDPDGADLVTVRGIRDDLDHRVQVLLRELTAPTLSRTQLAALTATPTPATPRSTRPSVLFVCVHNAGRSQMAAGFLTELSQGAVEVRSAGSLPGEKVNPAAVAAMAEVGIDISTQKPKVLTTEAVEFSDVVITMGCGDACPAFPGKRYLDWDLDDPAGQGVEAVRPIRDDIQARIQTLMDELLGTEGLTPAAPQ